jgi:diguanylate cyclase (GGDEF)-like protein
MSESVPDDDAPDRPAVPAPPSSAVTDPERLEALRRTALLDSPAEDAFDRLTRLAAKVASAPMAVMSLVDANRQFFKSAVGLPEPWASRRETPLSMSFCQHAVASAQPLVVENAAEHPVVRDNAAVSELGAVSYVGIPLQTSEGYVLGAFCVMDGHARPWTEEEVNLVRDVAILAMTEIELRSEIMEHKRTEEALRNMSLRDELTGLYNRRGFCEIAQQQLLLASRVGRRALLLYSDLDDFKHINDTYGHAEGDRALISTAGILLLVFRKADLVARMGGDEFIGLALHDSDAVADLIRQRLEAALRVHNSQGQPYKLAISIGVAHSPPDRHATLEQLIEEADAALYTEKRKRKTSQAAKGNG